MAITKTAKNMTITIKNNYLSISKTFEETAEVVDILATKGNVKLISNKKVIIKGNE